MREACRRLARVSGRRLCDFQAQMELERVEIAVRMQKCVARCDALGGDDGVDTLMLLRNS